MKPQKQRRAQIRSATIAVRQSDRVFGSAGWTEHLVVNNKSRVRNSKFLVTHGAFRKEIRYQTR
jgi:hypothetical protein